jgi:hypothetical protein
MSEEKRHLPRLVSAAIYLAVLVVALLPLVLTGTVAAWAALAVFVLNVVFAVIAIGADAVELGRAAGHRVGGGFVRRAVGIAAGVVVLIVTVWEFLPDDKSNPPGASSQPESVQQAPSPWRDCETASGRSQTRSACVGSFTWSRAACRPINPMQHGNRRCRRRTSSWFAEPMKHFNRRDLDAMDAYFAPTIEYVASGESPATGRVYRGLRV